MFKLRQATTARRDRCASDAGPIGWVRSAGAFFALAALAAAPVSAQRMESVDPDQVYAQEAQDTGAIDGDLAQPGAEPSPGGPWTVPAEPRDDAATAVPETGYESGFPDEPAPAEQTENPIPDWADPNASAPETPEPGLPEDVAQADSATYGEDDLIGAAEGIFGKGAEGLARLIEDLLSKQGEPNGYIVGREAGGAFVFGARYGSGMLHHKVEGEQKVYWTGPSLGFDAGANAANTFVLVYNLYDSEDLFKRYPAGEGQAYFVGGLHASYMRRGDVVLIPIRMGAGLRLGVNAGYMRFSKKQRWLPF